MVQPGQSALLMLADTINPDGRRAAGWVAPAGDSSHDTADEGSETASAGHRPGPL